MATVKLRVEPTSICWHELCDRLEYVRFDDLLVPAAKAISKVFFQTAQKFDTPFDPSFTSDPIPFPGTVQATNKIAAFLKKEDEDIVQE